MTHRTSIGRYMVTLFDTGAEAQAIADANNADAEAGDRYDVVMTPSKSFAVAYVHSVEGFVGYL
jgi:hypothetical protein